jgi:RNA polymerase sigma factor (sigma-70 family)
MIPDPSSTGGVLPPLAVPGLWHEAYQKYHRFWIALAKSANVPDSEAEEMLHAVLIAIIDDPRRRFESLEHVRNYVARAILNRVIERKKNDARFSEWDDESEKGASGEEGMSQDEKRELQHALKIGVLALPAHLYRVVKLRFFSGFTFQEMSEFLGLPISTIKSREEAALKRIRRVLKSHGF